MTDPPILVLCDRCRAEGNAREEPFVGLGDLPDFEPVPRKARADGWTPGRQRAFIAGVALSGSRKAAAEAVGMSESSATHLLKSEGSESSQRALEAARRIAHEEGRFRIAPSALRGGGPAGRASITGFPAPAGPSPDDAEAADKRKEALLDTILLKYILKVSMERAARLAGRIVEADFYVRQLTWLEVALDACSEGAGLAALQRVRLGDLHLLQVAETPLSAAAGRGAAALLGEARRAGQARAPAAPLSPGA